MFARSKKARAAYGRRTRPFQLLSQRRMVAGEKLGT